ncbi:hypothetical protein PPTG_23246 [Phytophthora nicotianae INRA-310]|uniref:Uncharacterized protein n=1 Tax=Phytophthora nicotianae (strain INRA-310) TaxID=761204 RepID=W2Q3V0_PHYN3|nr:hypothetical protein PPTG_23246 [Phytophthora nicotianae INRA-310]ETN07234.1 hypothetical protein PPTG_23246 [Phytophthora nicotianae INRA-310]
MAKSPAARCSSMSDGERMYCVVRGTLPSSCSSLSAIEARILKRRSRSEYPLAPRWVGRPRAACPALRFLSRRRWLLLAFWRCISHRLWRSPLRLMARRFQQRLLA